MLMLAGPCPWLATVLLMTATVFAGGPRRDALVFVVSAHRTTTTASTAELRNIYLGRTTRWKDGHRIAVIVRASNTEAERTFLRRLVRMSDLDFSQHWLGVIFRGEAPSPPQVIEEAAAVRKKVAEHDESIALMLMSELATGDEGIRALIVDGKMPGDNDYPFQ